MNKSLCLRAAAGHYPELRLLEPAGRHERVSWHGGLQGEEASVWVQRAGPGWCWLVYVPAEGRRIPARPSCRARTRPHWRSLGEAQEAATSHARAAPRTAAVQIGLGAGRGRRWPKAKEETLSDLLVRSCLLGFCLFSVIVIITFVGVVTLLMVEVIYWIQRNFVRSRDQKYLGTLMNLFSTKFDETKCNIWLFKNNLFILSRFVLLLTGWWHHVTFYLF